MIQYKIPTNIAYLVDGPAQIWLISRKKGHQKDRREYEIGYQPRSVDLHSGWITVSRTYYNFPTSNQYEQ
jgi:hypothetical protein